MNESHYNFMLFRDEKKTFTQNAVTFKQIVIDNQEHLRGSGKTTKLRHILAENPKARVFVPFQSMLKLYPEQEDQVIVFNDFTSEQVGGVSRNALYYVDELSVSDYLKLTDKYGIKVEAGFLYR